MAVDSTERLVEATSFSDIQPQLRPFSDSFHPNCMPYAIGDIDVRQGDYLFLVSDVVPEPDAMILYLNLNNTEWRARKLNMIFLFINHKKITRHRHLAARVYI